MDDKLGQLDGGDEFGHRARKVDLESPYPEVEIHDSVNQKIEDEGPTSPSLVLGVGDLCIDEGHHMMVPVHKDHRLLPKKDFLEGDFRGICTSGQGRPYRRVRGL